MSWDKIAKTGTYTDMHGNTYTFTNDDFKEIAENYKSASEKAPIVIGHPKTDSPAFGWVKDLRANGNYLEAEYEQVSDDIKKAVSDGSYKYKSISLYSNLKKLKHVGLLGATPPAISGLGEISFSKENENIILYFSENTGDNTMDEKLLLEKVSELEKELAESKHELEMLKKELASTLDAKKASDEKVEEVTSNFAKFVREEKVHSLIRQGKLEPAKKDEVLKVIEKLTSDDPAFASGEENELVESYLKSISKDTSLLGEFAAPNKSGDNADYKITDIVNKL